MRTVADEVLRIIAMNRSWARSYPIIHNPARNPRPDSHSYDHPAADSHQRPSPNLHRIEMFRKRYVGRLIAWPRRVGQ